MPPAVDMDVKEQVRQATDIVDLVGSYLPLTRQGRNFTALCPWHDDSRPSLQVNPEKQLFKCWVCDIGGDVFSFVMRVEGLEFRPALEMLAERAGISLASSPQSHVAQDQKKIWFEAMAWAERQFHRYLLEAKAADPARTYLREREITDDSIRRFQLGFSPADEWDWLLKRVRTTNFTATQLEQVGLVLARNNSDGHYDRFRGRLLFSIRDSRGRTIAFGGRKLPGFSKEDEPKYVNSPETPLFSKSRQLYGLDVARDEATKSRKLVVVEGYTDCIMAHQHGVENVVAVLGTALTESHIPLLRRYADTVYLVLDGDEAGRKRAAEVLEIFVANQIDLRILTLPSSTDPCDFIRTQGSAAFEQRLEQAVDAIQHKIELATQGMVATANTHQANTAIEDILSTLARARSSAQLASSAAALREQQVLARLARQFQVPHATLQSRLRELRNEQRRPGRSQQTTPPAANRPKLPPWEQELIELLLSSQDAIEQLAAKIEPDAIEDELARGLFITCLDLYECGTPINIESLLTACEDADIKSLLVTLDAASQAKQQSDTAQRISDLIHAYRKRREGDQMRADMAALGADDLSESQQHQMLENLFTRLKSWQSPEPF